MDVLRTIISGSKNGDVRMDVEETKDRKEKETVRRYTLERVREIVFGGRLRLG